MTKTRAKIETTTEPIKAGDCRNLQPEFGRTPDVRHLYGIKRGTLYNLHRDGVIAGIVLRARGQKSGCRLWDLASIRNYIRSQAS